MGAVLSIGLMGLPLVPLYCIGGDQAQAAECCRDQLTEVASSRFAVGQGTQQDVFDAEVELSILEERRTLLVQRRKTVEAQLAALLDRPGSVAVSAPLPLERTPLPDTVEALLARAEELSPMLGEKKTMVAQAERRRDLARRERLTRGTNGIVSA